MEYFKGSERVLMILIEGEYLPIGCLTSDSFSEEVDMLNTTTRENNGWETSRPVMQRFSVDFSGLIINTAFAGGDFDKISYDRLVGIKRSRELQSWKLMTMDGQFVHDFRGHIVNISDAASSGEMITFSGSIQGYGEPIFTTEKLILLSSGKENEYIQDGNTNIINP